MTFSIILSNYQLWVIFILVTYVMWIMNSFNFMDGIDTFSGLQAIPIFICYFLITMNYIPLLVAASLLAFLRFNYPPALTFMGDAGSLPLGYLIGVFPLCYFFSTPGVMSSQADKQLLLIISFIALCNTTFLFDSSITILKRALNKKNVFKPHREHLYQKAFDKGVLEIVISGYNFSLTILSSTCAIYLFYSSFKWQWLVYLLFACIFSLAYWIFFKQILNVDNPVKKLQ